MNAVIKRKVSSYSKKFPSVKNLTVTSSTRKGKRLKATFILQGKKRTVHFGLDTATTWADGASAAKRKSYQARASKITNKQGYYTYDIAGTANSFAYWILW